MRAGIVPMVVATALLPATGMAQDSPSRHADCTCRRPGGISHVGETACIATPSGPRIALCSMNQNVTSWEIGEEGCQISSLNPSERLHYTP